MDGHVDGCEVCLVRRGEVYWRGYWTGGARRHRVLRLVVGEGGIEEYIKNGMGKKIKKKRRMKRQIVLSRE